MDAPKCQKFEGKLSVNEQDQVLLTLYFEYLHQKSDVPLTVPLSELLEDMMGKEIILKTYETERGKPIIDPTTESALNEDRVRESRHLREQLLCDPYRPGYHFTVPEDVGRPGDPNGAFFGHDGRYHLMYLYNRRDVGFCWGHVSSVDLVHWRHHHDAIKPEGAIDGCFSGGAFVDDDGTAYLSYWIVQSNERPEAAKGIQIAKSTGYHYDVWENLPNVAIEATRMGCTESINQTGVPRLLANADPSNIWKKDGWYYMQAGNLPLLNAHGRDPTDPLYESMWGDWVDLFRSRDLITWEYLHRFYDYQPEKGWTDGSEDDMCPSFLPLPASPEGGEMSEKYLQLFIAHNRGCQYYIGSYDADADKFIPEVHGRMSWVDNAFFAPEALIDERGRQIMWAWLLDNPDKTEAEVLTRGWCGVYGLPRVLWLGQDGTLRQRVPPEFHTLRHNERRWGPFKLQARQAGKEHHMKLEGVCGASCELALAVDSSNISGISRIGFCVRTSPDEREITRVYYDHDSGSLVFDSRDSSLGKTGRPALERAPFRLRGTGNVSEPLQMRVFVDKCVVEVFINDRQAITRRVFPSLEESVDIYLFCEGQNLHIEELTAWEMIPSNPY